MPRSLPVLGSCCENGKQAQKSSQQRRHDRAGLGQGSVQAEEVARVCVPKSEQSADRGRKEPTFHGFSTSVISPL